MTFTEEAVLLLVGAAIGLISATVGAVVQYYFTSIEAEKRRAHETALAILLNWMNENGQTLARMSAFEEYVRTNAPELTPFLHEVVVPSERLDEEA